MNTNQLYFDGSLGQFIRKANYEQVSVNPTLEVQHGMSSLILPLGAGFKGDLRFNFSHASALLVNVSPSNPLCMEDSVSPAQRRSLACMEDSRVWHDVLGETRRHC